MLPTDCGRQKNTPPAVSLRQPLLACAKFQPTFRARMPIPRPRQMCTELPWWKLWNQTARLVPTMTFAIYFGELGFAIAAAIALLALSAGISSGTAILVLFGALASRLG